MLEVMVETLGRLGSARVIGFHGHGGLDELSTSGPSQVIEWRDGHLHHSSIDPAELGLEPAPLEAIAGGTAEENAAAVRAVLAGEPGPRREIVLLNAAAGLVASGRTKDMAEGLGEAASAIDSGGAQATLEKFVAASQAARA
jgi:anthranilate phosphoribosyltransferase